MAKKISNKYYLKNTAGGVYSDVTTLYDGVNILGVSGFDALGKTVNVYTAQWVNSTDQNEDFLITTTTGNNNTPVVIRENVNLKLRFIVGNRYASSSIDPQTVYDNFVSYMTGSDVWVASTYYGKAVHCMALEGFEPQTVRLNRGGNSYILAELTLHMLGKATSFSTS